MPSEIENTLKHSPFFFGRESRPKNTTNLDSKLATSEAWASLGQLQTHLSTSVVQHSFCISQYPCSWRIQGHRCDCNMIAFILQPGTKVLTVDLLPQ